MSKSVLIVEDVYMVRKTLERILQKGEYQVFEATDSESAMDLFDQGFEFDAILLDVSLPGVDGLRFAKTLKENERTAHIPIIICTAHSDMDTVASAKISGADAFIVKPFQPETVLQKLGGVLKKSAPEEGASGAGKRKKGKSKGRKSKGSS